MAKLTLHTRLVIGRDADCEVSIADDTVSRRHARVGATADGQLRFEDLQSSNGSWLKDGGRWRRVLDETLALDTRLRLGEYEVMLGELLSGFPALLLAAGGAVPDADVLEVVAADPDALDIERPRRNPNTGEIEERD